MRYLADDIDFLENENDVVGDEEDRNLTRDRYNVKEKYKSVTEKIEIWIGDAEDRNLNLAQNKNIDPKFKKNYT